MKNIEIINGKVFLSYAFLRQNNVPTKRIELWITRRVVLREIFRGKSYILFDSIPVKTQKTLPSKEVIVSQSLLSDFDSTTDFHYQKMVYYKTKGFIKHRDIYKEKYQLSSESCLKFSQLHSVWQYIIDFKKENGNKQASEIFKAYDRLYPGQYKTINSFCNARSLAFKNGAESAAFDKRIISAPQNVKRISKLQEYWVAGIVSLGKKYTNRQVWEKISTLCNSQNINPPSLSWIDKYRTNILNKNINLFESRNGTSKSFATQQAYASMQCALFANDQWQMDGWTLPFWVEDDKRFERFVIVVIKDAYSKKIVGSSIGKTENTVVIMDALRDAIIKTQSLPFEILTDNHSFNQTKEAQYFIDHISKIGCQFTVTSNPQYKSIVERYNQHLDTLCKEYYGYIGEGVKSKRTNAHPKQELIDEYAGNQISKDEAILRGIQIVFDFNASVLPTKGKTPNQLYDESNKPHSFNISLSERIKILTAQSEFKITRGQLNIKRGLNKYEYQLPANLFEDYNNETVMVRYEDLNESIYLYDLKTDEFIIELNQKHKIHGAKANQTANDIELLNKNKGRLNGVKSKATKQIEELTRAAIESNPDAYHLLNKITTPKNILKEFEQSSQLKSEAISKGLYLNTIRIINEGEELKNDAFRPKKSEYDTPYCPKNHTIQKLDNVDFSE